MSCLWAMLYKHNRVYTISCEPVDITFHVNECPICLEILDDTPTITLPCGHIYHDQCLLDWFEHNMTCPICRATFKWKKKKKRKLRRRYRYNTMLNL